MRLFLSFLLTVCCLLGGCASIVNGTSQVVSVQTHQDEEPVEGARCELANSKGTYFVSTPGTVTIHRAFGDLSVSCAKEGMEAGMATISSTTKPMAFGNILFGGAIGVVVDTTSGAAYDYPELIRVPMGASSIVKRPAAGDVSSSSIALATKHSLAAAKDAGTPAPVPGGAPAASVEPKPVALDDLRYLLPVR